MKSLKRGRNTLRKAEVSGITKFGIWLLINEIEFFLDYKNFPWFQKGMVYQIYNVELRAGKFLRWPELDVDLEIASLNNLEKYPLIFT